MEPESIKVQVEGQGQDLKVAFAVGQQALKDEDVVITESPVNVNGAVWHFFAVLDGHQGVQCANYVKERLWDEIKKRLPETVPLDWESEEGAKSAEKVRRAVYSSFEIVDRGWYSEAKPSGATATIALLTGNFLTVANVGDSSAFVLTASNSMELSKNHRIDTSQIERKRLKTEGVQLAALSRELDGPAPEGDDGLGPVRAWPGGLAVSRSIGDADVSPQVVCFPYIKQVILPSKGSRVLVATDGLWDCLSNSRILQTSRKKRITKLPAAMINMCTKVNGGYIKDDISVIAIDALPEDVWDFKALKEPEGMLSCCKAPSADVEHIPLFYEVDSLPLFEVPNRIRLANLWTEENLPPVSWFQPQDFTMHGEVKTKRFAVG